MSDQTVIEMLRASQVVSDNMTDDGEPSLYERAADAIERLIEYSACSGIAYRDEDPDMIYEPWRSLPDELRAAINAKTMVLDNARAEGE